MTILVTGGAGYVGSHTVRLLADRGHKVVVLDTLETGDPHAVVGADLVVGDTRDTARVASLLGSRQVDTVIHFAAYKAPGDSMDDPGRYFDNNVGGALSLLRALRDSGVRRVVFSSTCAVYGNPDVIPVDETQPPNPESPYGESKYLAERILKWFDTCHGVRSVILRYFNAAGASLDGRIGENWDATTNLVPLAIKATCGYAPPLKVFGTDYPTPDGTAIRDYVHVVDLAFAHAQALDYLAGGGASTVLNLGTGRGSSVLEVIRSLESASARVVPWEPASRRPGDPVALWADNTRAREVLGWKPRYELDDIVATAWRWHSEHLGRRPPTAVR